MTDNNKIPVEMYNMIKQFNKQREAGLICDAKCQNDNRIRNLQYKVTQNEQLLSNIPGKLLNSQRKLSQFDPKEYGPTFNKNINMMADNQINKLENAFNRSKNNIMQNLDFYNTQMKFKKSMMTIQNNKLKDLTNLNSKNQKQIGNIRVNQRMVSFYRKKTRNLELWVKRLKYIFWITIPVLLCMFFYYRNNKQILNKKRNLAIIFVFIIIGFMHLIMPIITFIWKLISLFPTP